MEVPPDGVVAVGVDEARVRLVPPEVEEQGQVNAAGPQAVDALVVEIDLVVPRVLVDALEDDVGLAGVPQPQDREKVCLRRGGFSLPILVCCSMLR
jgi:hypothetical protein